MIEEDFVSIEIAKLLEEKGFDGEDCFAYYNENGEIGFLQTFGDIADFYSETCVPTPSLGLAMKWLRTVHNIAINIGWGEIFEDKFRWWCIILNLKDGTILRESEYYATYEDAVEAAIKYCLKNLI